MNCHWMTDLKKILMIKVIILSTTDNEDSDKTKLALAKY